MILFLIILLAFITAMISGVFGMAGGLLLMGALGASLSTLRGLSRMALDTKIPERVGSRALTSVRPLVGAVAAVALYVLFASGLFSLGGQTLGTLLAAATVAGFSERFVTGLLEGVAEKTPKSAAG